MKKVECIDASNSELIKGNYYWVQDDEVDDAYYNILLPKGLEDGFWFKHRFQDVTEKEKVKNWIRHEGVDYPVYEEEKEKIMKKVVCKTYRFEELSFNIPYYAKKNISYIENSFYDIYTLDKKIIGTYSSEFFEDDPNEFNTPNHYDNSNGSLYDISHKLGLNPWEFDIIKRVVRCRKKGSFVEDLEKTKVLIDIYLKEWKQRDASDATK